MKVVIAYASVGGGHFKAAEAICNHFRQAHPEIKTELVDILQKESRLFQIIYTSGYNFLIKYVPSLWALGYWICYFRPLRPLTRGFARVVNLANSKRFCELLIQENPDVVISTHFLTSEIAVGLKKRKLIHSRVITVITDFGVHPFWISSGTDLYVVAADSTKNELIREGIKEEEVAVLGIPIDPKFLQDYARDTLLKKIGLKAGKFIVLIATGSFGIGPIEKIVELLHQDAQILVVCARNNRLYARLKEINYPGVLVFGFIDNIHELMAVSDLIITKPGGLTISESLSMDLVPVFISPIAGQEMQNIKFLAQSGIGAYPRHIDEIRRLVLDFQAHPDKLKQARENICRIKKPSAAGELCNVVCQGSIGTSD